MSKSTGKGASGKPPVPPRSKGGTTTRPGAPRSRTTAPRPAPKRRPPKRGGRRPSPWLLYGLPSAVVVVIVVLVVVLVSSGGGSGTPAQAATNYKIGTTPVYGKKGPEGVPLEMGPSLAAANTGLTGAPIDGIQCNAGEQLAYHHHVHVAIFVNGQPRSVPLGVGMVPPAQVQQTSSGDFAEGSAKCLYWLHVHAQDGIVHIESPNPKTLELGQFFDIWGHRLSSTGIGSVAKGTVTATVNGKPWRGDPANIPLTEHEQIVINVGGPVRTPPPISWSGTGL